ncbi:unnamed protein product [Rhizophagus irregularis]|nr:unnamed protein product [Rhizophagus irregularis]
MQDANNKLEIVDELKLHREADFYKNVIRFYGITSYNKENQNDNSEVYLLVMEYTDSKENYNSLTWNRKFDLASQLSCLNEKETMPRNLHSKNGLVHQNTIKLTDFGFRETPIPDTPTVYVDLFTKCWNKEPDNRPNRR